MPLGSPACCLQILVEEGRTCGVLSNGNAELLADLLIFAECRAHHCLTLSGCIEPQGAEADEASLPMSQGMSAAFSGLCGLCLHNVKCC